MAMLLPSEQQTFEDRIGETSELMLWQGEAPYIGETNRGLAVFELPGGGSTGADCIKATRERGNWLCQNSATRPTVSNT
jgi:hypothetical protein